MAETVTSGATVTVKVVPDVSGVEPAIAAEMARIGAKLRALGRDELAAEISVIGRELAQTAGEPDQAKRFADKLLDRFVIVKRPHEEPDASQS